LYNILQNKLENCKIYILYGDTNLTNNYNIIDNKYLIVKSGDHYEDLCNKTITLIKVIAEHFPSVKGLFKCDDDIIPNNSHLKELINFINDRGNIDYLGNKCNLLHCAWITYHFNKCHDIKHHVPKPIFPTTFCSGPFYYLSNKSVNIIKNVLTWDEYFNEDLMVGHILEKNGIHSIDYTTYYDDMNYTNHIIQNLYKRNIIYIRLHGGLGNQLFMVSAAYEIAKRNKMILILLNDANNMTHNTVDEFTTTIFSSFCNTKIENINISELCVYNENKCFDYDKDCDILSSDKDFLLNGYFQNKKYIDNASDIKQLFENDNICQKLLLTYPLLDKSYFIHIRIGDYMNHYHIYDFDKNTYYKSAIEYITHKDKDAHFFILSDDLEYVKKFALLENINKTIIEGMNTLDSFYLMTMCKKGGICANSTFSGWASRLNTNNDKIVIVPKQWINIDYEYEIPFDYTISF
jgi:hypothetical protein